MHAGLYFVAEYGLLIADGFCGGENLCGGDAKGMPKNWFTKPNAEGNEVVFPTRTPVSMVAVGPADPLAWPVVWLATP